jgi:hypothetical protein
VLGIAEGTAGQAKDIDGLAQELARRSMGLQDQADALIFKLQAS